MLRKFALLAILAGLIAAPGFGQELPDDPGHNLFRFKGPGDYNRRIFYADKLEFSLESGYLPVNIPFVFDFVTNSPYTTWPLRYTLVPNIASLRWQFDDIDGPWIFRGNSDASFSAEYVAIPRGPETRYLAFNFGLRRNFVPRNSRIIPYFDARGGVGNINAKGPDGVLYAQGQDLTFTLIMSSGFRYDFNSRYGFEAAGAYNHISNFYLSDPKYPDFGINTCGAMFGFIMRIGKEHHPST